MHCEQAIALISSRLDREIAAEETNSLNAHLADCAACRATAEAFALQDRDLRQTFEPRRQAVARVEQTVNTQREQPMKPTPRRWLTRAVAGLAVLAATVAGVLLYRQFFLSPPKPMTTFPQVVARLERTTPRPLPEAPKTMKLEVNESVTTGPSERRRLALPDGSVLFVDRDTNATLKGSRNLRVDRGNVYLDIAPDAAGSFFVSTPTREVISDSDGFELQVAEQNLGVVVTRGNVRVREGSHDEYVAAGTRLVRGKVEPAPRTSHLLDWTRELMAQGAASLVPTSQHEGGSLLAFDRNGQEAKLSLRHYGIDVHIEDGFARTTIDQTYFNHHPWRLEGTFHFPLPPDASLSQLTMYVNGERQEGGMVERQAGRAIYQKIVNGMRDPALLEWVDGTTFKMRVFPLEGRQEKRILLSYTQRLSSLYGQTTYRFPAGHSLQVVNGWSFRARIKDGKAVHVECPTHPDLTDANEGNDRILSASAKNVKVDRDVVLRLTAQAPVAGEAIDFRHMDHEGYRTWMARFRPELPKAGASQRRDWVFLFEASADRDPLLARVQIEIIRHLLRQADPRDTFLLVAANSRLHLYGQPGIVTAERIDDAIAWLEKIHLVGALDLGEAFETVAGLLSVVENPHLVHLGSGHPGMGRQHDRLKDVLPPKAKYVGVGVGKRWARPFMKGLAEKTGGLFAQINPDESVAWRAFELLATLNTPRLLEVKASFEGDGAPPVLVDRAMLAQGEELCVMTRVPLVEGRATLPAQLVVTGTLDGQPFRRVIATEPGQPGAGYLPRTWARHEIDRLLADRGTNRKDDIIRLSKESYVMTPYTSLLVLENEAMYREFNVEQGRKDHWAAFASPAKIPVVYEPDPTQIGDRANAPRDRHPSAAEVRNTLLFHVPARLMIVDSEGRGNQHLTTALEIYRGAFAEPEMLSDRLVRLWDSDSDEKRGLSDVREKDGLMAFDFSYAVDASPTGRPMLSKLLAGPNGEERFRRRFRDELDGGYGYHPPAGAMVVKGTSRIHSRAESPVRINGPSNLQLTNGRFMEMDVGLEFDLQSNLGEALFAAWSTTVHDTRRSKLQAADYFFLDPQFKDGYSRSHSAGPLHYQRLHATNDPRLRDDLFGFAPGLNTSPADVETILEAEAEPELRNVPGRIAPEAKALIDAARTGGWMKLDPAERRGLTILFDPSGRLVVGTTLPIGLQEEIVHDGETMWTLYPEIGLAARRTPSRHHRAEIAASLPHVQVPAADLARGHDLAVVAPRTVAIVPHGVGERKHLRKHLLFAEKGHLAERQLVEMPGGKVVLRQILLTDGVRVVNAEGKEIARETFALTPTPAPLLERDLSALVVLEPPYRDRATLSAKLNLFAENLNDGANGGYRHLPRQEAVQLLAFACLAHSGDEARRVLRHCFLDRDDLRPGLLVLMASAGLAVGMESWFPSFAEAHAASPIVRYFAVMHNPVMSELRPYWPINLTRGIDAPESFLGRLARFHELMPRWQNKNPTLTWDFTRRRHLDDALGFFRAAPASLLSRTLLVRMQDHGMLPHGGWRQLADAWNRIDGEDRYRTQYERAVCLRAASDGVQAREVFLALTDEALRAGLLPLIDDRFKDALTVAGPNDPWAKWVLETAERLLKAEKRLALLDLAGRCRELGDAALGENLVLRLFDSVPEASRIPLRVLLVQRLLGWGQPERAEEHLQHLAKEEKAKQSPRFHRLVAQVAQVRGQTMRHFEALEWALELEAKNPPEVVSLEAWRNDYRPLMEHFLERARVLADLDRQANASAREDLIRRTIRVIDRYRSQDPESADDCRKAGRILRLLGTDDLAWDYLTTPHAGRDESGNLHGEALELARAGAVTLAERLFRTACEADPDRGSLWWDRAQALQSAHRMTEARTIFDGLASGKIAPEDAVHRERAKWLLKR